MLSKRKSKNSTKNLSTTLQVEIDPLMNKLEYMNNKRPFKPNLPNVLEPSNKVTPNYVFTNFPDPAISSILHLPSSASSNASQAPNHSLHSE